MAQFPGFIGGSYALPSLRADAQVSLNLYVEHDQSSAGKTPAMLVGSPGLASFGTVGSGPIRGIWIGENRLFVVSGSTLYEVNSSGGIVSTLGDVGSDGLPVQIFPNGNQLAIVSAGYLYYSNGGAATQATFVGTSGIASIIPGGQLIWVSGDTFDATMVGRTVTFPGGFGVIWLATSKVCLMHTTPPNVGPIYNVAYSIPGGPIPASSGTLIDGYAVVSVPGTDQFNLSAIKDFSSWNPLDFGNKEGYPDHITSVIASNEQLYLLGSQTTEIYQDTGAADFPFARVPGAVLQVGLAAKYSPDRLGTGVAFISSDTRGGAFAVMIQGSQMQRISTYAIEQVWKNYSNFTDAVGYSYRDGGHEFWVVSFPTGNQTWVFDLTENLWHQRSYGASTPAARQRGYLHGYCFGKHIVGDYSTGQLYWLDLNNLTDAGTAIVRQRAAPHLSIENKRTFYSQFTLDVGTGIDSASPGFSLDWSKDGGNTWSAVPKTVTGGAVGMFTTRLQWRRLGHSRDRVFRVTSTAPIHHAWLGAYIESQGGLD